MIRFLSFTLFAYLSVSILKGQALEDNLRYLDNSTLLKNGLYFNENQFKLNEPVQAEIKQIGEEQFLIKLNGDTLKDTVLWGFSINGKPYIWFEDSFNKIINLGKLCHFTHKELVEFSTVDAFGFPVVRTEVRLVHYYFDFEDTPLNYKVLNSKNIDSFLDKHQMNKNLKKNYKTNKRLMSTIRLINNTYPIYIPYE